MAGAGASFVSRQVIGVDGGLSYVKVLSSGSRPWYAFTKDDTRVFTT